MVKLQLSSQIWLFSKHRLEQAKPRFVPKLGVASGSTDRQKDGNVGNVQCPAVVQDSSMVSF